MDFLGAFFELEFNAAYLLLLPVIFVFYLWWRSPKKEEPKPIFVAAKTPMAPVSKKPKKSTEGPALKIFWGSQTGTAEDFSETLCQEAKKHGFDAETVDLEEYDHEQLAEEKLAVFVVATYGEGEPTDNAKDFYDWLQDSSLDSALLTSLKFTVFGLGNTTYEHYNAIGRNIDKRLEELGAERVYTRGEGDDDSSLEEDFLKWKKGLWRPLCKLYNIDIAEEVDNFEVPPRTKMVFTPNMQPKEHAIGTTKGGGMYDLKNPFIAEIVVNRELHGPSSDRSCRHIEFAVGTDLKYHAGDHLGVYPKNQDDLVDDLMSRLGCVEDADKVICLYSSSSSSSKPLLGPCTLRTVFKELLDITSPPRKSVLRALVQYTADPVEKKLLAALSSDDESSLPPEKQYAVWIKQSRRTIGEVLAAFTSLKPPVAHMLELLPALAPRYYSISSSPLLHPNHIHITCVVTRFYTQTNRLHLGVASNHFLELIPKAGEMYTLPAFVRKSTFRIPPKLETPMIMVGPGTGLAPFRGFIQHRPLLARGAKMGESILFFGCRDRSSDYIYAEELEKAVEEGHLTVLSVAFSREQEHKVYVQHKLKELKENVWQLLENGAHFYICGDAGHMAPDVRKALEEIIMECGGKRAEEATAYVVAMQDQGRFATDVWH